MTLREQVEAAVRTTLRQRGGWTEPDLADAAIGVVVAALATQIEALVDYESADLPPGGTWISRTKVLAVLRGAGGEA